MSTTAVHINDRLVNVRVTPMYIIELWAYGTTVWDDPPMAILGPFTEYEVKQVEAQISVPFLRVPLRREVPDWAT
jgi:hypothetical protein